MINAEWHFFRKGVLIGQVENAETEMEVRKNGSKKKSRLSVPSSLMCLVGKG